jgi:hypothetical protein
MGCLVRSLCKLKTFLDLILGETLETDRRYLSMLRVTPANFEQ